MKSGSTDGQQEGICCLWIHLFFSFSALAFCLEAEASDRRYERTSELIPDSPLSSSDLFCGFTIYMVLVLHFFRCTMWREAKLQAFWSLCPQLERILVYLPELTPVVLDKLHSRALISAPLVLQWEHLVTWKQTIVRVSTCSARRRTEGRNCECARRLRRKSARRATPQRDEAGRHCSKAQIETDHRLYRLLPQSVACKFLTSFHKTMRIKLL